MLFVAFGVFFRFAFYWIVNAAKMFAFVFHLRAVLALVRVSPIAIYHASAATNFLCLFHSEFSKKYSRTL